MLARGWFGRVNPACAVATSLTLVGILLGHHVSGTPGVAAVIAFGASFALGARWASGWTVVAPMGYFCAAMAIALLPLLLRSEPVEAVRWIPVASDFDLRAGLWANLCFLAGHARLAALPIAARQGRVMTARAAATLTLPVALLLMPDGYSLVTFALMCAWILVTAPSPVAGDFRLARVRAWLGATERN